MLNVEFGKKKSDRPRSKSADIDDKKKSKEISMHDNNSQNS